MGCRCEPGQDAFAPLLLVATDQFVRPIEGMWDGTGTESRKIESKLKLTTQCASFQLFPAPVSTVNGTERCAAPSMTSFTQAAVVSASDSDTSNSSSS